MTSEDTKEAFLTKTGKASNLWTVYCHIHVESGRRYIGLTKLTTLKRWNQHLQNARSKRGKGCRHFWNAIRKYGKEAFSHHILIQVPTLEEANAWEEFWIDFFDTRNLEKGFNLAKGGDHVPHPIKNPWDRPGFREKVSDSMKEWFRDPINRASKCAISCEVSSRPDVKKKLSEATSKQFASQAARDAMSRTISELHQNPDIAQKFASGFKKSNAIRASKTHCKHGHEFSPENTRVDNYGWRYCKRCQANRVSKKGKENRTHCPQGHELSGSNIFMSVDGRRICVTCRPTKCTQGHLLADKPSTFHGRGCYQCKIRYDSNRRAARKNSINTESLVS